MATSEKVRKYGPKAEFPAMIKTYKTMEELVKLQKWYAQEPEAGMNHADRAEYFSKREYLRLEIERREATQRGRRK